MLENEPVRVTVIDRTNYHLFQPLLYQVATAALSPADIAAPIRARRQQVPNMDVLLAEAQKVDVAAKKGHHRRAIDQIRLSDPGDRLTAFLFRK